MPKPLIKKRAAGGAPPAAPVVLGSNKQTVNALLGSPVMAGGLLGMTAQGENASAYPQPGDDLIVGFFDDVARYLAVVRTKGPLTGFSPGEMSSILALNGRQIIGWQPGNKPFVFFLLPSYPNQPPILLNEWQVERAIG